MPFRLRSPGVLTTPVPSDVSADSVESFYCGAVLPRRPGGMRVRLAACPNARCRQIERALAARERGAARFGLMPSPRP